MQISEWGTNSAFIPVNIILIHGYLGSNSSEMSSKGRCMVCCCGSLGLWCGF